MSQDANTRFDTLLKAMASGEAPSSQKRQQGVAKPNENQKPVEKREQ